MRVLQPRKKSENYALAKEWRITCTLRISELLDKNLRFF
ncbi:hypothetical protein LEP1GSC058_1181 [Leptospira fainei serovar Hurstbridge str. BUT 6]|uniref:Uncharacterized protein n=1 Tax=Leptospira fainei serovar Hurstbridge str. BUT 6 TaxID=1193011 RepID=S3W8C7_9LEPT|nr:hypothetical protein LEP1GSC058_1181 [Leptospira fainei serovar Hurstbridge str. BUT 6]